mgnify:CR=1 FL=1
MNIIDNVIKEIEHLDYAIRQKYIPESHYNIKTNLKPLWKLSKDKATLLEQLTIDQNPKTILELGTSSGYSTLHLKKGAPAANIFTIEFDPKKIILAKHHFNKANIKINIIEARVNNALNHWSQPLDLVFMDCDKDYLHYFKQFLPYLNENALIIADNIEKAENFEEYVKKNYEVKMNSGLLSFHANRSS